MHYTRWVRHGDPLTKLKTGIPSGALSGPDHFNWRATITYSGMHGRLRRTRGPADLKLCADCGATASDWSYIGGDPDELVNDFGFPFSLDPQRYVPRCKPCHIAFDARRG